jgi:uncharacterized protein involved in exopolysaccharide biosynthesis
MKSQPSTRDQLERGITLLRRSRAFWKRALLIFVAGVAFAVPYVLTRPRSYRSETVVLYHETLRTSDLTGGDGSGENARRVGARLREMLLSRASLEPIIVELGLYMKKGGKPLDQGDLIEAVDDMRKSINFRAREGDTFEISFIGSTPKEAQEVTKRLADAIVQEAASRRSEQAKTLKDFLVTESERNKNELKANEAELARFVALHSQLVARLLGQDGPGANQGVSRPPTSPTTPGDATLASLEARAFRIEKQLKMTPTVPPPPPRPVPTFVPPPDSAELVAARKDLAEKNARFTEKHPDVIAAKTRLKTAEAAQATANQEAAAAFAAAHPPQSAVPDDPPPKNATDEAALRKELSDLQAMIAARRAAIKGTAVTAPSASAALPDLVGTSDVALEVEFRRLQREVSEGRERQHQLDDKLFRASITASSVMNDRNIQVSILDPAFVPMTPVSKPRSTLLMALVALSFMLALATAIGSAALDDRVYDRVDLERLDVLPVLGVIPRAELPPRGGTS